MERLKFYFAINICAALFLVLILFGVEHDYSPQSESAKKYREENHIMSDGTQCIILRGGTHSGVIGLTCNYKEE